MSKKSVRKNRSEKFEFPNFDRLDAENAQFRPENRILHAKLCIYTAGKAIIPPTKWFLDDFYVLICFFLNRIMGLMLGNDTGTSCCRPFSKSTILGWIVRSGKALGCISSDLSPNLGSLGKNIKP